MNIVEELWPDPDRRDDALVRCLIDVYQAEDEPNRDDYRRKRQPGQLTETETRYLRDLSHGLDMGDIARLYSVRLDTVRDAFRRVRRVLGAKSREHAVAIALRQGLIK